MEKNKIYRLKDAFAALAEGQHIITNGDDFSSQQDFFAGTIIKIQGDVLMLRRDDGEPGGGENDEWTILNDPESTADVILFDDSQYTLKTHSELQFGDIIEHRQPTGAILTAIVLQKLNRDKLYIKNLFENPNGESRPFIVTITEEVKTFFHIDRIPCSVYGCTKHAVRVVAGNAYCAEHLAERGRVVTCHDCGTELFESDTFDLPSRRNAITGRRTTARICESCRRARIDSARVIHEYSYKPVPQFITVDPVDSALPVKIFEGIEEEVECQRSGDDDDDYDDEYEDNHPTAKFGKKVIKKFFEPKRWFYLKRDGSLSNGFELVTHPATLNGHYELPWEDLCAYYKTLGIEADTTSTCGLHIHMNKDILDKEHRIRLAYFVAANKPKMELIARRAACSWAGFKNPNGTPDSLIVSGGKYEALNWSPPHTVEFRLFKGTTDYKNLMSSIEFVHAATTYTGAVSLDFLKDARKAWPGFIKHVAEKGYKFLPDYLKAKGVA